MLPNLKIKTKVAVAAVCVPVLTCSRVDSIYPVQLRSATEFRSSLMSLVQFVCDQRPKSGKPVEIPREDGNILVLEGD